MKKYLLLLCAAALFSCQEERNYKPSFTVAEPEVIHEQEGIGCRAITIDGDKVWYAGSMGNYGYLSLNGGKNFSGVIAKDTLFPELRAIAQTKDHIFILNAGTPALLYKISKDGKRVDMVYTEEGEKVFYDSMKFRNDKEGIAMGDPTGSCLSIITTKDGGETWQKLPCDNLPEVGEGEAGFAASNTNIVVKGGKTWIASGGKQSRVFYSKNGEKWKVYKTPIVQGSEMTGMFSMDFYDDKTGFAVGGNYEQRDKNSGNKILTEDGGKSWELVGEGTGSGYASCVQFVPESKGNELVTVGPAGIFYSFDRGITWKKLLDEKGMHTIRFIDSKNAIAAGQNKIIRLRFK
jgi:photosystem II stability/assembly factor-like uncharacterized protein